MTEGGQAAEQAPAQPDLRRWTRSVAFAAVPLVLFLVALWVFSGSEPQVRSVLSAIGPSAKPLAAYADARVGIVVLNYGTYVFVHTLLCLGAIAYFLAVLRARAAGAGVGFQIRFAAGFAALVSLGVIAMTVNQSLPPLADWSVFSGLFVEPARDLFRELKLESRFERYPGGLVTFLYLALLVPTVLGIVSVVAASAAFHQVVLSRRRPGDADWQKSFVDCVTVLKRQLTLLSVILVSSVLTARDYGGMMPSLVDPDLAAVHGLYAQLADALSFAGGMLFTATLFAAFAPGAVLLVRDIAGLEVEGSEKGFRAVLAELKIDNPTGQIAAVARIVLTLVAPALAGPFMGVVSTVVG